MRPYTGADLDLIDGVEMSGCSGENLQVMVHVLQRNGNEYFGGFVENFSKDGGWNEGGCYNCRVSFKWRETPYVSGVTPRIASPGDVITVSGRMLISDRYHSVDGQEHRRMDAALKHYERVYITQGVATEANSEDDEDTNGASDVVSFACELSLPECDMENMDPKERCPTMYRATDSSFQCRVPPGVPSGAYNVSFVIRDRGGE